MRDLTDLATKENWAEAGQSPDRCSTNCTLDGKIYCVPVNIHSWQWIWLSNKAFADAGVPVPTNWDEFVAAAPALEKAGKVPLAIGKQPWQQSGAFNVLMAAIVGKDDLPEGLQGQGRGGRRRPRDRQGVQGGRRRPQDVREVERAGLERGDHLVITGQAGGQIMGDWAQGEFQVAGQVAGKDYTCLPGLGVNAVISTGGDAFYFPKVDNPRRSTPRRRCSPRRDDVAGRRRSPST